ncbi:hypothetical protein M2349_000333 [Caldanaerobacter subterraneus subsp. tengcongensis MB4]|uniref:Uncharacterized protein n=1 Tax=Caldanaerobacter subterraneus subsp. tengcongensis (strain DSM 15242 / JCM 11007 / NBRC 100824 / MB4) TaxID=273068 RepID=Q8R8G6_CALS4|nr:hypothetical protein [Caldanaerobacter subterraneus]AAM25210.1 hypothetical protein TTE2033 [Caldanaerobacter subterraneus subsp. tengcongensis MB4]MCS3915192.1 hypothetical protein [Caldanaerobacter subterraneus subsp. tengcongensis MB4]
MHGTIIQLEEKPLRFEEDFICEEDFYDDFVGVIADYVSDDVDRAEEIQYFVEELKEFGIVYNEKEQSITFLEGFKDKYFAAKFFKLKEAVENLSFEDFVKDTYKVWEIQNLINKKYGTYIHIKGEWMTLDTFVRYVLKEGIKYYIGSVLDYHF